MSQKNETKILALTLLLTVGIVGGSVWWFTNNGVKFSNSITQNPETGSNLSLQDRISFGEKSLTLGDISPVKKEGVQAIAAKSYDKAIANFTDALKLNRNDPETLIFLNNARIGSSKSYTIMASVPFGTDPNAALEILRGIAQAQNEINTSGGVKGVPLRVGIANDDDNPQIAKQIASNLVSNSEVLGVVGPNTSDSTLADRNAPVQLVKIVPGSRSGTNYDFEPVR